MPATSSAAVACSATPPAETVNAVFAVFRKLTSCSCAGATAWRSRDAVELRQIYWDQCADFGRRHLASVAGLERLAELGKVVAAAPEPGLPLYAGWRAMPLADDAPAQAFGDVRAANCVRPCTSARSRSPGHPVEASAPQGAPVRRVHGLAAAVSRVPGWQEDAWLRSGQTNRRMGESSGRR